MIRAKELMPKVFGNVLVRTVALNVGQGDSTLFFIRDGFRYATMLVDINMGGKIALDVPALIKSILGKEKLDIFLNTHPHEDHLHGIDELDTKVGFKKVMLADYNPGKGTNVYYDVFDKIVKRMKKESAKSVELIDGSYSVQELFDAQLHVLAPAEYVTDDTADKSKKERRELIHENCVVLKVGDGKKWVLQPGDADYDAFKKHIYDAHTKDLKSTLLLASHHGSKHFFWPQNEDNTDEPWKEPLDAINPDYVIISAPRRSESKHDHPDKEALDIYEAKVEKSHVYHTGAKRESFIFDIYDDGTTSGVYSDDGGLMQDFQIGKDEEIPFVAPTKANGDEKPRQFG